jgi:alkylation response protein AidB-like acyl-CoA dehydrogenase
MSPIFAVCCRRYGNSGYTRGVAVERFDRDAGLYRIYEGTARSSR